MSETRAAGGRPTGAGATKKRFISKLPFRRSRLSHLLVEWKEWGDVEREAGKRPVQGETCRYRLVGGLVVVWKLNPTDLALLKDPSGARFTHFMDRLIRAEAACCGLAQAEIATQLRTTIKDGGVDTEVKGAITQSKTGWFAVPTCWQFKAGDVNNIDDKKKKTAKNDLQKEINKPYVKELITKGYGYRICVLDDLTPPKVQDWESQLKAEAKAINPDAPDPRVIHGGYLLEWAERYPAIVAQLRNWTQGGFHWDAWRENCRDVTPTYVPNPEPIWEGIREQIRAHARLSGPSIGGEACLTIGGAAGVGKTRLVFETLNEMPEAAGLVLYLADEREARAAATAIATVPGQTAILVADECSPPTRHFLNENFRGHRQRIRMICLDNTGERAVSATGQVWLRGASVSSTDAILAVNFALVPEDRRRLYVNFTKGFVRFAADMCRHDAELAAGDLSRLLQSVEDYVRERLRRMQEEFLPIASLLALFHKVGSREDVVGELDALCAVTSYSGQQFHDAVRVIRESPGFVVQAGRYWYVTPEIVARVLFNEGWERWVSHDLGGFLGKLPDEMRQQLLERVGTHARKEVRDEVQSFFRGWFGGLSARDLADPHVTSLAAALIETSPEEYLPRLRSVIETAQPGELQRIQGEASGVRWGPRRTLVWLFERLVSFPEYFDDCEASLFRLALAESEPQIGNNATAVWANLFSIYLAGTATPFLRRMPILQNRTNGTNIQETRLGFAGLARALQGGEGHVIGEPVVSGRLRPDDWKPATHGEERASYRSALELCASHLHGAFESEHHRLAFQVLAASLYTLLGHGLADDLRRLITPDRIAEHESRQLLQTVDHFLQQERSRKHAPKVSEHVLAYLRGVQDWSNLFRPTDFAGRLRSVCARDPWDQGFAHDLDKQKDETDELASLILQDPPILAAQLDWLASPEAQSAERLGFALGRIDATGSIGHMIFQHAIAHTAAPALRGYVRGMVYAQRPPDADLLTLMSRLEAAHPELAVDVLTIAGDSFDAFNRILRLVDSQTVSPSYLANLAVGLGRRELTADEATRLLPYFAPAASTGESDTALAGVRFLHLYLLHEACRSSQSCLTSAATQSLAWELVDGALPYLTGHNVSAWIEILKKLAAFDPDRAARLLSRGLLEESVAFRKEADTALIQLAQDHPESVMDAFGAALLDPDRGWLLQVGVHRELLGQLPAEVVLSWVRVHGIEAARVIARHLPPPRLDNDGNPFVTPVLDAILREYDDDQVFAAFLGGSHSGEAWWGNGGDQFRGEAENAKQFLNYPNHRVREWANFEIDYRMQMAEREAKEHDEWLLPS